ncbi:hypothetical protein CEY16_06950 [Halalkalibacillus sediminis]|uniref:HTH cro/C1-type domain-containing protein n=1 Tax=Halalkalibacillus sediminis TaxID=2018042 RepID=A0A2I0QTK8_9BACI|nr:helix-turn-helix transcriptional regulator [Halalkalibacillus sediminis]PKR77666.1 hypothetical protein CEY16_06950 [Halalkalibacillus sediminis]
MQTIGEQIKTIRKNKKLTLTQVAGEKMSAAMVSLIENNKTKPTVETLQHIARTLNIDPQEIMGGMTREELASEIEQISEWTEDYELEGFLKAIDRMENLLPHLSNNYESARIYEKLAKILYFLERFHKDSYEELSIQNYFDYTKRAKEIYHNLQMKTYALEVVLFEANIEHSNGNFKKTLDILNESIESLKNETRSDMKSLYVKFLLFRIHAVSASGDFKQTFDLLDEAIEFSKKHVIMDVFYELHNTYALLLFNENQKKQANKHLETTEKLIDLTENTMYRINTMEIKIHFLEYFENQLEEALVLADELEEELKRADPVTKEVTEALHVHLSDARARCYTKLEQPQKALPLFQKIDENFHFMKERHPIDSSLDYLTPSYEALCYLQLGEFDKAQELAEKGVELQREFPHLQYYQFSKEVLKTVRERVSLK